MLFVSDYEYLRQCPPSRWAWEFLRRNEAYRSAWQNRSDPSQSDPAPRGSLRVYRMTGPSEEAERWGLCSFR